MSLASSGTMHSFQKRSQANGQQFERFLWFVLVLVIVPMGVTFGPFCIAYPAFTAVSYLYVGKCRPAKWIFVHCFLALWANQTTTRHVHVRLLWGEKPRWCFVDIIFMEQCPKNYAHYSTILRRAGLWPIHDCQLIRGSTILCTSDVNYDVKVNIWQ